MDLNDCYKKNYIKKTKINKERIKSIIEISEIHEETVNSAELNERNICTYFTIAYDSLREILEAICILNGYKVANHICLGELVSTLIPEFDFNQFDRMRFARNGINYYGEKIEFNQGKELIKKMFKMKHEIYDKYLKKGLSS
jgi:hypothetical protein